MSANQPELLVVDACEGPDPLHLIQDVMADSPLPVLVTTRAGGPSERAESWIRAGALDVLGHPAAEAAPDEWALFHEGLVGNLRLLAGIRVIRHLRPRPPSLTRLPQARPARYLGLVASTGGPPALAALLKALGPRPNAAVVVVQHIGESFQDSLVSWLSEQTLATVELAVDGHALVEGRIYVAPAARVVALEEGCLRVRRPLGAEQPGDALLGSLARVGASATGVVLTGIGSDGAEGLRQLRLAGGLTLAQDQATSAVWGMPRAAARLDAAREVLSLTALAERLGALYAAGRARGPMGSSSTGAT
jgi:two-component system chemotaxis response regulator CheB